jgi:hypothetical protein
MDMIVTMKILQKIHHLISTESRSSGLRGPLLGEPGKRGGPSGG